MLTRRAWALAAGILLGAAADGVVLAQETCEQTELPRSRYNPIPPLTTPVPRATAKAAPETVVWKTESHEASQSSTLPPPALLESSPANDCEGKSLPCQVVEQPPRWQQWKRACQEYMWGYPKEFESPPLGHFVYLHNTTQVLNGEATRMVLYQYDFVGEKLTLRGKYQLEKIADLLPRNFFPIVIEATPETPNLGEARRVAVLNDLAQHKFLVPAERVVVGRPIANGLRGVEADVISTNQQSFTRQGGPIPGGTGGVGLLSYPLGTGAVGAPAGAAGAAGGVSAPTSP